MNIDLLFGNYPASESPGLDSTDPLFDEISTLVLAGNYVEAAQRSEQVISGHVYDIRVICYFLYGHFQVNGLSSLADILHVVTGVMGNNWEAVGPVRKKEKNVQTSLDWLFRLLAQTLQHEESKKTPLWDKWQTQVDTEQVGAIIQSGDDMRRAVGMRLEESSGTVIDNWSKIQQWLRLFQNVIYRNQPVEPPEEVLQSPVETPTGFSAPVRADGMPAAGSIVEGSCHLDILQRKLAAFERLIEQQKYLHASLLADEINGLLSNFDPRLYFPKLFARFMLLQAKHIADIGEYMESRDTMEWQALSELLKVDIDAFVEL